MKNNRMLDWEGFNVRFFNSNKAITWYNRKGVIKLNDKVNAEITLVTNGHSGTYQGYNVNIINKEM